MNASSEDMAPLIVRAADAATEIFLVDASFRRQAKGVGELRTQVTPGIYKLRFRAAQTQVDRLIMVESGQETRIEQAPVPFVTAIPLDNTADTNPSHQLLVQEVTASPARRSLGIGAKLCVFARDASPLAICDWSRLTIHRLDGVPIADIADAPTEATSDIALLSLEVDPGTYRLRVSGTNSPPYECFLPLVRGWQTLIFMHSDELQENKPSIRIPRLADASVTMLRIGKTFDPTSAALRLSEQLRYNLECGRDILTDRVITDTLNAASKHPMLALYAAHLLIRKHPIDHLTVEHIVDGLQASLGVLPDVGALLLRPGSGTLPKALRFETPPLLRSSWNLIVEASRRRMSLVPLGSLSAQVGEALIRHPLWLLNGLLNTGSAPTADVMSFAAAERLLEDFVRMNPEQMDRKQREKILQVTSDSLPLERTLLNTLLHKNYSHLPDRKAAASVVSKTLKQIVVPMYSVAHTVQRIKNKLGFLQEPD